MTVYHDNILELRCPGYYCGRLDLGNGRTSDCGSCPTGTRVNLTHIFCQPCTDSPSSYDLMYLLFMATVPLLFHAVYIDLSLSSISWASQVKRYLFLKISCFHKHLNFKLFATYYSFCYAVEAILGKKQKRKQS